MDEGAKTVLDEIRRCGPDCIAFLVYGDHGLDKGFYTQADINTAINDHYLKLEL